MPARGKDIFVMSIIYCLIVYCLLSEWKGDYPHLYTALTMPRYKYKPVEILPGGVKDGVKVTVTIPCPIVH